jgi:hypothetical protein
MQKLSGQISLIFDVQAVLLPTVECTEAKEEK